MKRKVLVFFIALLAAMVAITVVLADDGKIVRKRMSHSATPSVQGYEDEAEHAFIGMMKFYVPSQASDGVVEPIEYFNVDEVLEETREHAKPLIGVYIYGPSEGVDDVGFVGHGRRDAYGAVSLDDGNTWKKTNLSESAGMTSCKETGGRGGCTVTRSDIPLFADTQYAYPGDVVNIFHAIAGNKVLVAWPSRFCSQGQPNYSLDNEEPTPEQEARRAAIADYLGINLDKASPDDLYLVDMYGVGGQQGSVDYAEDKFEQNHEVGEVPYSCLWTARGVLVDGDDPRTDGVIEETYMRWFKAERLTSGRRDANRIETKCVEGAGCAITWQEDPDGLRPGQGEGPGEGWSGAIANSKTDIWYSYLPWSAFDVVQDPTDESGATPMAFADYTAASAGDVTQKPKPFVPFAMPMRMTDNAKCNVEKPQPYCNGSAINDNFPDVLVPMDYGLKDMCADVIQIPTGKDGTPADVCVSEDGMPLVGNTASTRPRLSLHGYDSRGKVKNAVIDSAFVVVVAEEDKGLGAFGFTDDYDPNAAPCDPKSEEEPGGGKPPPNDDCTAFDEGKNIWYHSFSMALDDKLAKHELDGLLRNLTSHGNMLNQPEVSWEEGEFFPARSTAGMWDFGEFNYDIFNTEIARRGSLLTQDIYKVHRSTSKAKGGLIALPAWKQGAMNQGGPADVMVRRIIIPKGWKARKGNPYAFRNMDCDKWAYKDGSNPYYPEGVCLDSAINLSATVPDSCLDSNTGAVVACPQVIDDGSTFGVGDTSPILQGEVQGEGNTTKVLSWHQCPSGYSVESSTEGFDLPPTCDNDERKGDSTLADQSWYNPLDVSKGHRGFLDGDFVMMLYAWSPNWRLNAKGNDRYELYIRRSFDGAQSWGTLPRRFRTWDKEKYSGQGTVSCETYRSADKQASGDLIEPRVCYSYRAGAAEQARNVTQLKSMKTTTLDPRYAISGSPQGVSITADPFDSGYQLTDEDTRDGSRFFIAYETGDNTTTAEGEPEPLDLFYSRAVNFGDNYQVWAEEDDLSVCYPSDPHDNDVPEEHIDSGFCNEFDQLDQGTPGLEASESSLAANPGGQFLYAAWSQLDHEDGESNAMARRVWWLDDYISETDAWVLGQGPKN